jgi:hypothetical protein
MENKKFVFASRFRALDSKQTTKILILSVASLLILITGESILSLLIYSLALVSFALSVSDKKTDMITTFAGLISLISVSILWWHRQNNSLDITHFEVLLFTIITISLIFVFYTSGDESFSGQI